MGKMEIKKQKDLFIKKEVADRLLYNALNQTCDF
jgi:hypothetical protein